MIPRPTIKIYKNPVLIGIVLLYLLFGLFGFFRKKKFTEKGLFTVCKVLKLEGAGDGADLYLEVYFNKKTFTTIINDFCVSCQGEYHYCKVLPGNKKDILFFNDIVPTCIVNSLNSYDGGWVEIPIDTCR